MLHRKEDNRRIVRYVLPSICAMVVSFAYNVVDGMFVGQGIGPNALAAVNLSVPFTEIMTALASMLTVGGATVMAIRKGRGEYEKANHAFLTSTVLVLSTGLLLTLIGALFPAQIAKAFGATALLMELTTDYIRWYSLFAMFFTMSIPGCAFVRNDDSPGLAFWGMVSGAIANIFLDWLFVFPLQWGIKGAAIASGPGQIVSCLILSIHFIKRKGILRFKKPPMEIALLKKVTIRGLPEFVIQISQPATIFCYNHVILKYLGEAGLASFSACTYLLLIVIGVFFGVSQGIQPLIGNSYGEKSWADVQYYFRSALFINFFVSAAIYVLFVSIGPAVLSLFITDDLLIPTAYEALRKYGASMLPASVNIVYITFFLSTKNTARSMVVACSRGFVFNSLCIFAIPAIFGAGSIWFPMMAAELITIAIAICLKTAFNKSDLQ